MKHILLPAVLLLAVLSSGCARETGPPNVLLITVDTLRPDRLGCYGHTRQTSPTIDALAAEGVRFEHAYSVAGWTLPSMATIMTGRYPRDHGATDFHWSMDPLLPTMAGILRGHGYDTRGYVSHVILQPRYGLAEGFKSYDYSVLNIGHPHDIATAKPLTELVMHDLDSIEEPFFLWVHYFDPHFAYLRHAKWADFGDADIDRYDQEIAHTDEQISRLLKKLGGRLDNTIIIFTSDHGEEFGEHGAKFHYTLYEEIMRVPLIVKAPGLAPGVSDRIVEQIDLLPTLMSLLHVDPGEGVESPGRDALAEVMTAMVQPVFFERDRPPPYNQRGVLEGNYKLFVIEEADTSRIPITSRGTYVPITTVHPGIYMYDLAADPDERNNIYREDDPTAKQLLVKLARHFSVEATAVHEVDVDDSLRDKLRSLGYIH